MSCSSKKGNCFFLLPHKTIPQIWRPHTCIFSPTPFHCNMHATHAIVNPAESNILTPPSTSISLSIQKWNTCESKNKAANVWNIQQDRQHLWREKQIWRFQVQHFLSYSPSAVTEGVQLIKPGHFHQSHSLTYFPVIYSLTSPSIPSLIFLPLICTAQG